MRTRTTLLIGMILLVALARLLPHPPNFTPVGAMALFCAAHFRSKRAAFLVPLAAMLAGDLALEVTTRLGIHHGWLAHSRGLHAGMGVVYGAVALSAVVGLLLRRKKSVLTVAAASLTSSLLFFLVTNFPGWAGYHLYPLTWEGVLQSYTAALPFFHWTLFGDAAYASLLFGGMALAEKWFPMLQPATA